MDALPSSHSVTRSKHTRPNPGRSSHRGWYVAQESALYVPPLWVESLQSTLAFVVWGGADLPQCHPPSLQRGTGGRPAVRAGLTAPGWGLGVLPGFVGRLARTSLAAGSGLNEQPPVRPKIIIAGEDRRDDVD
jgi:hypothetical protein